MSNPSCMQIVELKKKLRICRQIVNPSLCQECIVLYSMPPWGLGIIRMSDKTTFQQHILELTKRENPENTVNILKGWIIFVQNEEIANLIDLTNNLKRRVLRLENETFPKTRI